MDSMSGLTLRPWFANPWHTATHRKWLQSREITNVMMDGSVENSDSIVQLLSRVQLFVTPWTAA